MPPSYRRISSKASIKTQSSQSSFEQRSIPEESNIQTLTDTEPDMPQSPAQSGINETENEPVPQVSEAPLYCRY